MIITMISLVQLIGMTNYACNGKCRCHHPYISNELLITPMVKNGCVFLEIKYHVRGCNCNLPKDEGVTDVNMDARDLSR